MKLLATLALGATTGALASAIQAQEPLRDNVQQPHETEKYMVELAPYQTRWVTEEEKWELKLVLTDLTMTTDVDVADHADPGWSQLHRRD